jgi:hypothetical protein
MTMKTQDSTPADSSAKGRDTTATDYPAGARVLLVATTDQDTELRPVRWARPTASGTERGPANVFR